MKHFNQMDIGQANSVWDALSSAIDEIYLKNSSQLSFEELYRFKEDHHISLLQFKLLYNLNMFSMFIYRNAYNLVLNKHGEFLYQKVSEKIRLHLLASVEEISLTPDTHLLTTLSSFWGEYVVTMNMVKDILMYMDRTFVAQQKKEQVFSLALRIFKEEVLEHANIQSRVQSLLLGIIEDERAGQLADDQLLSHLLGMLINLGEGVYENEFEQPFLQQTKDHFRRLSLDCIASQSAASYVQLATRWIREEEERASLLHPQTEGLLRNVLDHELITAHISTLVGLQEEEEEESETTNGKEEGEESDEGGQVVDFENIRWEGALQMVHYDEIEDLRLLYTLFHRVPTTLSSLRQGLYRYITTIGSSLMIESEKKGKEAVNFVSLVLELKRKMDNLLDQSLQEEKSLEKSMKEAFEHFLNLSARPASHLASFIDHTLKSSASSSSRSLLTDEEVERKVDEAISVFQFIQDKDVFENFYKTLLAKRLLGGRSVDQVE